jgi:hypothetical protein
MEYSIRQSIAKRKYELELDSLRLFELTTILNNIKNSEGKVSNHALSYALNVAQNNIDMVTVEIARHKIELKELNSRLSS